MIRLLELIAHEVDGRPMAPSEGDVQRATKFVYEGASGGAGSGSSRGTWTADSEQKIRDLFKPVAVVNFMNYEGWEWGKIAAGGTLVILPVLVFAVLVRRYLVYGLTAGAVRG